MTHRTDNASSDKEKVVEHSADVPAPLKAASAARRRFVKAGIVGVPVIVTLRSRAAWGQGGGPGWVSIKESIEAGSSAHPDIDWQGK